MKNPDSQPKGPIGRIVRRLHHSKPPDRQAKGYLTPEGDHFVITCEGCGVASQVELEHGLDTDNPAVSGGYFAPTCPHCGQPVGTVTTPRVF